jgi:hypothetical protein
MSAIHGSAEAGAEVGHADLLFVVFDGHGVGIERSDDVDLVAGSGDPRVDKVSLEQEKVLFEERDDDDRVFAALAFVN